MTYDEIWACMSKANRLYQATGDMMVKSAVTLLALAQTRIEDIDGATDLNSQEQMAVDCIESMDEAYLTLYGKHP